MLKYRLIHPQILEALGGAGHGAKVLIADGNYPASTKVGINAEAVYLNITPKIPSATEVLKIILTAIEIESAAIMQPERGKEPPIFKEFRKILPEGIELERFDRGNFYEEAQSEDLCLVIITGEDRLYANILLTIGALKPSR